jgi:ElaB/YqjD/DUF883 family membrane-anchored ribosome-binding protein
MDGQSQAKTVKDAASEAAQNVMDVAADTGRAAIDAAADAGARVRSAAQYAGRQATMAADTAYDTGSDVADLIGGAVRQNPWTSLAVALAAGYGLACLVKQTRR